GGRRARRCNGTQAAHRHRPGDIPTRAADPGSALCFPQGRDREMVANYQGGRHQGGIAVKLPRRQFLHLAAGAAALPGMARFAFAQAYPSRPVRLIVTTPAGGSPDIIARLIGHWLSERVGQPIVVDNRSGASGNIGTEIVVSAPPDGYTPLMAL